MIRRLVPSLLAAMAPAALAQQPSPACTPTAEMHAFQILGRDSQERLKEHIAPEIYGAHNFRQTLPNGWEFVLSRAEYGWGIHVFADGTDITTGTPPRSGPNPRELHGWHFRNADNTGPNTGEVNAPQAMRAFVVDPSLAGLETAGPGIGWLNILDYGLSDLARGETARMTWLKFDACVSWPKTEADKRADANAQSPVYIDEEIEIFGRCGLDLTRYDLKASLLPRSLRGDLDGDGALDDAAQITAKATDAKGLAICRAGTWIETVGLSDRLDGLPPGYIGQVEAWHWVSEASQLPRRLSGIELPDANGDILILERIEKQAVAVFWQGGRLQAEELFHLVTE